MQTIKVKLEGISTILMHSAKLSDPLDPGVKQLKLLTSKKKKTDEDHLAIARKEFEIGMYFDPKLGPYLPSANVLKSFVEGARLQKLGTTVNRSVQILQEKIKLEYKGPRTVDALWDQNFYDKSSVVVQSSRCMRCRAAFTGWSVVVDVAFDENMINPDQMAALMEAGGQYVGLGDYRPNYGRYKVSILK